MSVTDEPAGGTIDGVPAELAEAGVYATSAEGFEHGLVALSMGQAYWLVFSDAGYRLLVEPPALALVREQLACFDRESIGWPPPPVVDHPTSPRAERFTPLVWAMGVLAMYAVQSGSPGVWEAAGALDSQAVFDRGEWWRVATALFLHADLGHVFANVVAGFFVFSAVTSTMGRLRGWLLLALAAAAGNLAVAALNYPGPYRSIGASTAVFAGLGLLTGRAIRVLCGENGQLRWRTLFVPLAAGVTLLGLFGAGGLRTDVVAHAMGFAAGLVLGASTEKKVARVSDVSLP
jgi:membrane associated rhomboid family serine protease